MEFRQILLCESKYEHSDGVSEIVERENSHTTRFENLPLISLSSPSFLDLGPYVFTECRLGGHQPPPSKVASSSQCSLKFPTVLGLND